MNNIFKLFAICALSLSLSAQFPTVIGGTGTHTQLTNGSVVVITGVGGTGAYGQDHNNLFWDITNKRLCLAGTSAACSFHLSLGGAATTARTFGVERNTTAATAGNSLTISSGSAVLAGTDKAGGNLILQTGVSTGTGSAQILLKVPTASTTGTSDNAVGTAVTVDSTGLNSAVGIIGNGPVRVCNDPGNHALATAGTNTTLAAATSYTYVSEICIPMNGTFTGISVLAGGTAGAANHWTVALFPFAGGATIANSASVASAASTNAFYDIAFTATKALVGPGCYWVALQSDGTTDKIQTFAAANSFGNILTQKPASTVYGTFVSLTPPTGVTADVGPIACLYK